MYKESNQNCKLGRLYKWTTFISIPCVSFLCHFMYHCLLIFQISLDCGAPASESFPDPHCFLNYLQIPPPLHSRFLCDIYQASLIFSEGRGVLIGYAYTVYRVERQAHTREMTPELMNFLQLDFMVAVAPLCKTFP